MFFRAAGQASTFAPNIAKAKLAALNIFQLIDTESKINSLSTKGKTLPRVQGKITLRNVKFSYPRRPDVQVMDDTDITIQPGETVALVGESGCGKSTIVWLLERFYDPTQGSVMVDDVDVKDLNLRWLRRQIGLVTQEPKLFSFSIRENIAYGNIRDTDDGGATMDSSLDQVVEAAKSANIHEFIEELPGKYETLVGEKVRVDQLRLILTF
jgi:ATP-binding cassette subfamily B (MDR/TAP) protein 1